MPPLPYWCNQPRTLSKQGAQARLLPPRPACRTLTGGREATGSSSGAWSNSDSSTLAAFFTPSPAPALPAGLRDAISRLLPVGARAAGRAGAAAPAERGAASFASALLEVC